MAESLNVKPPPWLEFLVSRLVPPACREHVLGDFSERYTSPRQYTADALRTLPFVVAGQIRRTSDWLQLLMCVIPAFVFFGGLRSRPDGDPVMWLSALAPTIGVAIAVVLRTAYRSPATPSPRQAVVDAAAAVACALLSQAALAVIHPQWVLAPLVALGGSVGTFTAVFVLRSSVRAENDVRGALSANDVTSRDGLARDVRRFEQRIRQRNRREVLAGLLVVVGFGVFLWRGPDLVSRIGCGLAMAGALFIIYYIRRRGVAHRVPTDGALSTAMAVYRRELERQRDLLRTVTWWYLLPLLPAMVVLMLGQAIMQSRH
jgi:hypothetical protein